MGAERRAGERAQVRASREACLPGLRKARVPRGRPGPEWGRVERAPPSGIWAGSLSERRDPAEVCVYVTALGGEAPDSGSSPRGSASVNPRRRWALGGPRGQQRPL